MSRNRKKLKVESRKRSFVALRITIQTAYAPLVPASSVGQAILNEVKNLIKK